MEKEIVIIHKQNINDIPRLCDICIPDIAVVIKDKDGF